MVPRCRGGGGVCVCGGGGALVGGGGGGWSVCVSRDTFELQ